jgi:hypothetical protein
MWPWVLGGLAASVGGFLLFLFAMFLIFLYAKIFR